MIRELLLGDLNRLRFIQRFGTVNTMHKESVAEHSFYVVQYAYMICLWVTENTDTIIDYEATMIRALVHDWEECRTGDFPRPFKYRYPELKEALEIGAEKEFETIVNKLSPENAVDLIQYWKNSRDDSYSGLVVGFADFLAVVSYLWQEVECANYTMKIHYDSVFEYSNSFNDPKYNFIRSLVSDAQSMVVEMYNKVDR